MPAGLDESVEDWRARGSQSGRVLSARDQHNRRADCLRGVSVILCVANESDSARLQAQRFEMADERLLLRAVFAGVPAIDSLKPAAYAAAV